MDLEVHVSFENGPSLQSNYEELIGVKLEFLHGIKEYPWGQCVMQFYDYDKYIVEVALSMQSVAKRFEFLMKLKKLNAL